MQPESKWNSIRAIVAAVVVLSCVGCDQATKAIVRQNLKDAPPQFYLANTVRIEYALNPGGFLSLGSNLSSDVRSSIFIIGNTCVMIGVAAFVIVNRRIAFSRYVAVLFFLAGCIGNQIDRITNHGLVTDFVCLGVGPVHTGVFNIADMALMFGAIAFALLSMGNDKASSQLGLPA